MLYKQNNEKLDTQNFKKFNKGSCSTIYKSGNKILKVYNHDCRALFRLSKQLFQFLKRLDDRNIVKLYNYYYLDKSRIYKLTAIDAYTMEYIKKSQTKLVDIKREQLLELLKSLDETLRKLSENKVILVDLSEKNIIINDNRIVIIDPDMSYFSKLNSKETIYELNKTNIIFALNAIITDEMLDEEELIIPNELMKENELSLDKAIENQLTEETIKQKILKREKLI